VEQQQQIIKNSDFRDGISLDADEKLHTTESRSNTINTFTAVVSLAKRPCLQLGYHYMFVHLSRSIHLAHSGNNNKTKIFLKKEKKKVLRSHDDDVSETMFLQREKLVESSNFERVG
jgi:hypothetical protein